MRNRWLIGLILLAAPAFADTTPLGTVCANGSSGTTGTLTCSLNTNVNAGTILLVSVTTTNASGGSAVTVADAASNSYSTTICDTASTGYFLRDVVIGATVTNALTAGQTITVTIPSSSYVAFTVEAFSGGTLTLDGAAVKRNDATNTATTASFALAHSGDEVFVSVAIRGSDGIDLNPGAGWTKGTVQSSTGGGGSDRAVGLSYQHQTGTPTISPSVQILLGGVLTARGWQACAFALEDGVAPTATPTPTITPTPTNVPTATFTPTPPICNTPADCPVGYDCVPNQ